MHISDFIVLLAEYIRFSIRMKAFGYKFKTYFPSFIYSKVTKMCFEMKNFRKGVNPKKKKKKVSSILKVHCLHRKLQFYIFTILSFFLTFGSWEDTSKRGKVHHKDSQGKFEQGLIWQKINFISLSIIYIPWTYRLPNGRDISPLQQQTLQKLCRICDTILHNRFNCF